MTKDHAEVGYYTSIIEVINKGRKLNDPVIHVKCVKCGTFQKSEIDELKYGQFMICKKCKESFNIYSVYSKIYCEYPIAKEIVEAYVAELGTNYHVETTNSTEKEKIELFMKKRDFETLLDSVIFDTVVFGNSFVEKENENKFRRIDPTTIEIKIELKQVNGFRALTPRIEKLVQRIPEYREIKGRNIIHFSGGDESGHEPLGASVYGFWLHTWYSLDADDANLRDSARNQIVIGSGIPLFKIDSTIKVPEFFQCRPMTLFQMNVEMRREKIASVVEREIFPLVVDRPFKDEGYPRFKFRDQ